MSDQKIGKVTIKSSPQPSLTNNVSSVSVKVNDQNTQRVNTIQYGGSGDTSITGQQAFDRANSAYAFANTGYTQANNASSFANGAFARANSAYNFANTLASSSGSFDRANAAYAQANSAASFANGAFARANAAFEMANSDPNFANGAFTTANSAFLQANNSFNVANLAYSQANTAFNSSNNRVLRAGDTMTGLLKFNTPTGNTIVGPVFSNEGIDLFTDIPLGWAELNWSNTNYVYVTANQVVGETSNTSFQLDESAKHFRVTVPGNTLELSQQEGLIANTNLTVTGEANVEVMLHVGTGSYVLLPDLIAQFTGNTSQYSQVNQQNLDANGSADFVVTADIGTDLSYFTDLGKAGSNNISGTLIKPLDSYLIAQGLDGSRAGANLFIMTQTSGFGDIVFAQGGVDEENETARFVYNDGFIIKRNLQANGIVDGTFNLKDYTSLVYNYANTISYNVSLAYTQANAAFDAANNAGQYAQPAYNQANNAFNVANAAFSQANNSFNVANVAYVQANNAASFANSAYAFANTGYTQANNAASFANGAFTQANNAASFANGAFARANSSYDFANTGYTQANNAASFANGAFTRANSAASFANGAFTTANSAASFANGAFVTANSGASFANSAYAFANTGYTQANNAASFANGAFTQANNAASFANGAFARANSAYGQANSAASFANGAFTLANTKFNSSGGTISGDVAVTGNLSVAGVVTSVNTQVLLVRDNIITVNSTVPTNVPAPAVDSGVEVNRGLYQNTQLVWSEVAGAWRMSDGNTFASIASANLVQAAFGQSNNAFNVANAAFLQANNAFNVTNVVFGVANSASSFANGAFTQANNAASFANGAFDRANSGYNQANSAASFANGAFARANSSYEQANSAASFANGAFVAANSAASFANGAFTSANNLAAVNTTQNTNISSAQSFANGAFSAANSAASFANGAFTAANVSQAIDNTQNTIIASAQSFANGAFSAANSAASFANGAFDRANSSYNQANTAASFANGAFTQANNAASFANGAFTRANSAYDYANTGYAQANSAASFANGAFTQANNAASFANSAYAFANTGYTQANNAASFANGAFTRANSAASFANGAFDRANSGYIQANNAASFANGAFDRANSGYAQANSAASFANGAFVTGNSAFAQANNSFNVANAAFNQANNSFNVANVAYVAANNAGSFANSAYLYANTRARVWESDTPPASANNYDIWVDSSNGVSYIYTTSNNTSVWVEYGPIGTPLSNLGDFTFNSQTMTGSYANQDVIIYQMGTGNIVLRSANTVAGNLIPNTAFSNIGTVANPWNKIVAANVTTNNVSVTGVVQVNNSTFLSTSAAVSITGSANSKIQTPGNDGYMLHITGKDNVPTRTVIDAYGTSAYPALIGRRARGLPDAPTAVQNGDVLLRLAGNGYGTTGFAPLGVARIDIVATENYTDTARGSQIKFYNVNQGTNVVSEIASFNAQSVTFNGTITAGGGFAYTSRSNTSNSATQTIDFASDSSVRMTMNQSITISFANYTTGKIVDLIVQNLDNNPHTFTHGCLANNSSKGTTSTNIPAQSLLYCRYISYDGDLANTFAIITIG